MRITRQEILKAIRVEKLKAGHWITSRRDAWGFETIEDDLCKVCVVGAVLRQKGISSDEIYSEASRITNGYPVVQGYLSWEWGKSGEEALKRGYYMNALSIYYEQLANKYGSGKRTRAKLVDFVKKNFPKVITV